MKGNISSEDEIMKQIDSLINKVTSNIDQKSNKSKPTNNQELSNNLNILDVYDMLSETNHQLTNVLDKFRHNLNKSNNNIDVNNTILNFTKDFYKIKSLLEKHSNIYNNINFTHIDEAKIGKQYMEMCLKRDDRDTCLSELASK